MGTSSRYDIRQIQSPVDRNDPLKAVPLPLRREIHALDEGPEAGGGAEEVESGPNTRSRYHAVAFPNSLSQPGNGLVAIAQGRRASRAWGTVRCRSVTGGHTRWRHDALHTRIDHHLSVVIETVVRHASRNRRTRHLSERGLDGL